VNMIARPVVIKASSIAFSWSPKRWNSSTMREST
jgi:hypothetical protein